MPAARALQFFECFILRGYFHIIVERAMNFSWSARDVSRQKFLEELVEYDQCREDPKERRGERGKTLDM
jgi:hypothetical protein